MKRSLLLLLLAVVVGLVATTAQSGLFFPDPKIDAFKPVVHPQQPGPVDLVFRFAPPDSYKGDGTFEVRIVKDVSAFYSGPVSWTITALPDQPHEEILTMTVLPDTVVGMILNIMGENYIHLAGAYFVHRNDSVEFWKGYPEPLPAPSNRIPHYELTPEVLSEEHIVRLMIDTDEQEAIARRILGTLPDTTDLRRSKLRMTYKKTLELLEEGIQAYFYTPTAVEQKAQESDPGWLRESSPEDSALEDQSRAPSDRSPAGISLALAVPQNQYGDIMLDDNVYLYLNAFNTTSDIFTGSTNGFRIWSPNGATWDTVIGEWIDSTWYGAQSFIHYGSVDGIGSDTIGFGGFRLFEGVGLQPNYDQIPWRLTILGLDNPQNIGKSVCIDSSFYRPSNTWTWATPSGSSWAPPWSGPYCFDIAEPTVTISGCLRYSDFNSDPPQPKPIRHAFVHILDVDATQQQLLATCQTDQYGQFGPIEVSNIDIGGTGGQDISLKPFAHNYAASVMDSAGASMPACWTTPVWNDVPSGSITCSFTDTTRNNSKYFYVLDVLTDGKAFAESIAGISMPDASQLKVVVDKLQTQSHAGPTTAGNYRMFIQDSTDVSFFWPDTWDESVILHEYGHILALSHEFCDDIGAGYPGHSWYSATDDTSALFEGFAHFFSGAARNSAELLVKGGTQLEDTAFRCLETGAWGHHGVGVVNCTLGTANCYGAFCEGTVAGVLWDIIDDQSFLEEFSDSTQWGQDPATVDSSGDGIGDELTVPIADVFEVLLTNYSGTGKFPDTIEEFWKVWISKGMGYQDEMHAILFEHGIVWDCCIGIRGNVDGDLEEKINVADMTTLIAYLFKGYTGVTCLEEADVNGDGLINVTDMTYLIAYLFSGGPHPVDCAGWKSHVQQDSEGRDILTPGAMTATSK
jgi:hypothetical protein